MPRMREASRSGWNGSSASVFSPTPTKAMGRPVTWRTESAAPPRESPSILVRITRVDADRLVEALGDGDRVLPGHRVDDQQHVVGRDLAPDRLQLVQHRLVDVEPAGGVEDERREAARRRLLAGRAADLERRLAGVADDRHVELRAERAELVHRGGPVGVGGGQDAGAVPAWRTCARAWRRWWSCPSPAGPSA